MCEPASAIMAGTSLATRRGNRRHQVRRCPAGRRRPLRPLLRSPSPLPSRPSESPQPARHREQRPHERGRAEEGDLDLSQF